MSSLIEGLNEPQQQAVQCTEGPLLLLAAAGSGKTRTLTHRIAYLIAERGVHPSQILAVTFTNKAAREMRERVQDLLPPGSSLPFVGTFHAFGVSVLRRHSEAIGVGTDFTLYDASDQVACVRRCMRTLDLDPKQFQPKALLSTISQAKNAFQSVEQFAASAEDYFQEVAAKVYATYSKELRLNQAFDFDDLLVQTVRLLREHPDILAQYHDKFHYVMVDEYQDTNHAQYLLVQLLSSQRNNICVVGDDWQSIYSWRGANIQNILDFERDYPGATTILLEQNYRSTQNILDAASAVIAKNAQRKHKEVWTDQGAGEKVVAVLSENEMEEQAFLRNELRSLQEQRRSLSDVVFLYRTNAQSRALEEFLLRHSMPYEIVGGVRFYERKEIKDVLAYLRFLSNPHDVVSFERIVNVPARGLGEKTVSSILDFARSQECTVLQAISKLEQGMMEAEAAGGTPVTFRKHLLTKLCDFRDMCEKLRDQLASCTVKEFLDRVLDVSGYRSFLNDGTEDGAQRLENVQELYTVTSKFDDSRGAIGLSRFLEEVALVQDTDSMSSRGGVTLMTLHSAKGLEFPFVFLYGMEEGIFPHSRSFQDPSQMEEERRLCYVGITRAKERVYLLHSRTRMMYGGLQMNDASRFLNDVPEHLVDVRVSPGAVERDSRMRVPSGRFSGQRASSGGFQGGSHAGFRRGSRSDAGPTSSRPVDLCDGDHVQHQQFGSGIVISVDDDVVTVAFRSHGVKKISASVGALKKSV